ncbi:MAG: outer membrane protein-like protein [Sphingobacteriales bacterium]|nr:outer membrane protein-like protein [Sphingobacteriales bacterium]
MRTLKYISAIVIVGLSLQACNNRESHEQSVQAVNDSTDLASPVKDANKLDQGDDGKFVNKAASGGQMEVELGGIAQINGGSSRVKKFGDMMVADHSKANNELKALAKAQSINLPAGLLPEHQKHVDHLKAMHGVDFDKAYMKMMLEDHQEDVKDFQNQADNGSNADIKAFAAKTVAVLRVHLDSAKAINATMKKTLSPGNVTEGTGKQPNH